MRRLYKDFLLTSLFFSCAFLVLLYFGKDHVFTDYYPVGDIAADMLLESKIDRDGVLLTGHYSRYRFNHPGPFFFYYQHVAHRLLDWTSLSATDIWAISTTFLNTFFVVLAAALASRLISGQVLTLPLVVFTLISVSIIQTRLYTSWMPYKLIGPYMAFFLSAIFIARRRYRYLPLAAILGAILIHGYVTLILFTLPVLAASLIYGHFTHKGKIEPHELRQISYGLLIGAVFALPILFDALLGSESNLQKIIGALGEVSTSGSGFSSSFPTVAFASRIFFENVTVVHFSILLMSASLYYQRNERLDEARRAIAFLFLVITAIFIFYYQTAPKPLHELVGMFYSALCISVMSMSGAHVVASGRPVSGGGAITGYFRVGPLACLFLALVVVSLVPTPGPTKPLSSYIPGLAQSVKSATSADGHANIAYEDHSMWKTIAGLLVELERQGYESCSTWSDMAYLYTERKTCGAEQTANIAVIKAAHCDGNCISQSGDFGLIAGDSIALAKATERQYRGQRQRRFGRALMKSGDLEGAIAMFEKALEKAPDNPMVYHDLALASIASGDLERALALVGEGLDIDPHNGWLLGVHGDVLRDQGRFDEAIKQHRLTLRAVPSADSHDRLGTTLLAAGRTQQAATQFRRALELAPNHLSARKNLALAERQLADDVE